MSCSSIFGRKLVNGEKLQKIILTTYRLQNRVIGLKTPGKENCYFKISKIEKNLKILRFFNRKFRFPEIFSKSEENFKKGIYVIEIHTTNTHTKFQSNIFVFVCEMAKFFKCICFAFLIVVHKNKWHFWNPVSNLHKLATFL